MGRTLPTGSDFVLISRARCFRLAAGGSIFLRSDISLISNAVNFHQICIESSHENGKKKITRLINYCAQRDKTLCLYIYILPSIFMIHQKFE